MTPQKPSVGRIVHYQPFEIMPEHYDRAPARTGQPWPAVVTEVHDDGAVGLHLLCPAGQVEEPVSESHPHRYWFAEHPTPGHWSWPPRS